MREWRALGGLMGVAVSLLGLGALLSSCGLYQEAFSFYIMDAEYATMEEVRVDNVINRGWIPEFMPASAYAIKERHSGDTNEGWGTFQFEAIDREDFDAHWRGVSSAPLPRDLNRFSEAPKVDWWPEEFGVGYEFFQGISDHDFWMAMDVEKKIGYFWQDR